MTIQKSYIQIEFTKQYLVLVLIFLMGITSTSFSQEIYFPNNQEAFYPLPNNWTSVPENKKVETLRILIAPIESSLKKISSLTGKCSVQYKQGISPSFANELGISDNKHDNLHRIINCTVDIFSDLKSEKTLREISFADDFYEENSRKVEIQNAITFNIKSILTKDEYIYSRDAGDDIQSFVSELPDFLDIHNKRIGWREPPELMNKSKLIDIIDPYEYFDLKEWANIAYVLQVMEGKFGDDLKKQALEEIHLFESKDDDGMKWFRYFQQFASKNGKSDLILLY